MTQIEARKRVVVMIQEQIERRTMSVEEAGRRLGVSRNTAYEAAGRGEIPTIRIGRRMLVPVIAFERLLDQPRAPQSGGA